VAINQKEWKLTSSVNYLVTRTLLDLNEEEKLSGNFVYSTYFSRGLWQPSL